MDYPYAICGSYTRKITTKSADAQRWFDRGLNWCFGYHHQEAGACFAKALEFDPDCAMAHWGIAYASGPNYNMPWEFLRSLPPRPISWASPMTPRTPRWRARIASPRRSAP